MANDKFLRKADYAPSASSATPARNAKPQREENSRICHRLPEAKLEHLAAAGRPNEMRFESSYGCQPSSFIETLVILRRLISSMFRMLSKSTRCVLPIKAWSRLWTGRTVPSSVVMENGTKGSAPRSFCISSTIGMPKTIVATRQFV
jgi:hypothetical protein